MWVFFWGMNMHYYQFSIGDYRAATAHLSNEEDLAYRRLLDMYYDTEKKIPVDTQWVAKRLRLATEVVDDVLKDMFVKHEDGWFHARCNDVIQQYHAMAEKNRANGRLGGRKKNPVGNQLETHSEPIAKATNNHKPLTINQEPETKNQNIDKPAKSGLPPAPYRQIIDLYHEILPELPRVIVETEDRKRLVKSFWGWVLTSNKASGARRAETAAEAIEYCKIYFELVRGNDFVMGRTERSKDHRNWKASIDYLLSDKGKKQIIENA
jgi:uncharacterized protein YdaU (DUF1376 family)